MIKRLALFIAATLAFWILVGIPARIYWGNAALIASGAAAALCLAPTTLTMAWAGWAMQRTPEQQLVMVLGGTTVRMVGVLVGGWVLTKLFPALTEGAGFWSWVLVFYLFTLALEMGFVLSGRTTTDPGS